MDGEEVLNGTVEAVRFQNDTNGFTVIELDSDGELIIAVGTMPTVTAGEAVSLTGNFTVHASFGEQFKVTAFSRSMPETTEQIYKYLASGIIRGIGPKKAATIVNQFGSDTLEIIENEPERLASIRGISFEQAREVGEEFKKQYAVRTVMLGLEKYGLSPSQCLRIFIKLGINAVEKVRENPYCLCGLGIGISFELADSIERKLETKPNPNNRVEAGILHIMSYNTLSHGHTCIPRQKLFEPASQYLGVTNDEIDISIDRLTTTGRLKIYEMDKTDFVFLPQSFTDEQKIADRMCVVANFPPPPVDSLPEMIDAIEEKFGVKYEEQQRIAIATAAKKGLLTLTGGPGTGKTTTIRGIISIFERQGLEISLAAPTGRAAKRMSEVTGMEAKTVHRLLEVEWDEDDRPTFRRNLRNSLDCQVLILDELSMIDIHLFASLLDALPLGCRLILVGDSDQLPPVGAGNVLHDIIESGVLPVVCLSKVFRQALESKIVTNAHKIVGGDTPDLNNHEASDFFHMEKPSAFVAAQTVVSLCAQRLPDNYGYDALNDIQVISPTKNGNAGTVVLNSMLQNALNSQDDTKHELKIGKKLFREGDKVMQIKNNYNINWETADGSDKGVGVFNGDIGILKEIDSQSGAVTVDFDGRVAVIGGDELDDMELAYAITVHKSQGSEFKCVILPAIAVPPNLAYRNLLYTAITRARDMLVCVGSAEQINRMALNDKKARRYSALARFLEERFS